MPDCPYVNVLSYWIDLFARVQLPPLVRSLSVHASRNASLTLPRATPDLLNELLRGCADCYSYSLQPSPLSLARAAFREEVSFRLRRGEGGPSIAGTDDLLHLQVVPCGQSSSGRAFLATHGLLDGCPTCWSVGRPRRGVRAGAHDPSAGQASDTRLSDSLRRWSAAIRVDGVEAEVFRVEHQPDKTTCFIVAEEGMEFEIMTRREEVPNNDEATILSIDGMVWVCGS